MSSETRHLWLTTAAKLVTALAVVGGIVWQVAVWMTEVRHEIRAETAARVDSDKALASLVEKQLQAESDRRAAVINAIGNAQMQTLQGIGRIEAEMQRNPARP